MTPTPKNPTVEAFLGRFFTDPNRLRQESKPEIGIWVERIRRSDPQPTVLPCFRGGSTVDWYGLAFDDRQLTALGESLTAFVGPTYTTFRGEVARLDPTDPIDTAVRTLTDGRAFKFRGEDPKDIWRVLERMRRVWERRGARAQVTPRPVARLLRDFYMALRARDENAAGASLLILREGGHLDGVNHLYLQMQFLSAFHRWGEITGHPQLPDVLRLRRPMAVTEAILQAVYNLHLSRFEDPIDPRQAADAFRAEVLPRYPSLFGIRAGMRSGQAVKLFMLLAVTAVPANLALRDELLGIEGLDASDTAYLSQLAQLAGPTPQPVVITDHLAAGADAARVNDYDRAFALGRAAPPSVARARLLCECAFELGTLDARSQAIDAVRGLGEAERGEFLSRRMNQQLWDSLREVTGQGTGDAIHLPTLPGDWCAWVEHLDRHNGGEGSREIARRGASEWSVEEFARSGGAERFVRQLGGNRSQAAERALRESLPHLLAFFEGDSAWPNPHFRRVYRALIDLLFFSTEGGRADLTVFSDLLDGVLVHGVGAASDFVELVTFATELWTRVAAPTTVDWGIEVVDLLVAHPCPDPPSRVAFFQAMLDRLLGFARHVTQDQRFLLGLLAADLGVADTYKSYFQGETADHTAEGDDPLAAAGGLSVAAYTLTERAARQFQQALEARAPGVRVSLCHDTVASSRLKQLARQADLFVMTTSSAKHAATICIEANRPNDRPLLRPVGRGAASMLRAVREYLAEG
jgi:hypothetical protein